MLTFPLSCRLDQFKSERNKKRKRLCTESSETAVTRNIGTRKRNRRQGCSAERNDLFVKFEQEVGFNAFDEVQSQEIKLSPPLAYIASTESLVKIESSSDPDLFVDRSPELETNNHIADDSLSQEVNFSPLIEGYSTASQEESDDDESSHTPLSSYSKEPIDHSSWNDSSQLVDNSPYDDVKIEDLPVEADSCDNCFKNSDYCLFKSETVIAGPIEASSSQEFGKVSNSLESVNIPCSPTSKSDERPSAYYGTLWESQVIVQSPRKDCESFGYFTKTENDISAIKEEEEWRPTDQLPKVVSDSSPLLFDDYVPKSILPASYDEAASPNLDDKGMSQEKSSGEYLNSPLENSQRIEELTGGKSSADIPDYDVLDISDASSNEDLQVSYMQTTNIKPNMKNIPEKLSTVDFGCGGWQLENESLSARRSDNTNDSTADHLRASPILKSHSTHSVHIDCENPSDTKLPCPSRINDLLSCDESTKDTIHQKSNSPDFVISSSQIEREEIGVAPEDDNIADAVKRRRNRSSRVNFRLLLDQNYNQNHKKNNSKTNTRKNHTRKACNKKVSDSNIKNDTCMNSPAVLNSNPGKSFDEAMIDNKNSPSTQSKFERLFGSSDPPSMNCLSTKDTPKSSRLKSKVTDSDSCSSTSITYTKSKSRVTMAKIFETQSQSEDVPSNNRKRKNNTIKEQKQNCKKPRDSKKSPKKHSRKKEEVPKNQMKITDTILSGAYEFNHAKSKIAKAVQNCNSFLMDEHKINSDDELPDLSEPGTPLSAENNEPSNQEIVSPPLQSPIRLKKYSCRKVHNAYKILNNSSPDSVPFSSKSKKNSPETSNKKYSKKSPEINNKKCQKKSPETNNKQSPKKRGRPRKVKDCTSTISVWLSKKKAPAPSLNDSDFKTPSPLLHATKRGRPKKDSGNPSKKVSPPKKQSSSSTLGSTPHDDPSISKDSLGEDEDDFNYSIDSWGKTIPKRCRADETVVLDSSMWEPEDEVEEERDPLSEYIRKQREIEANKPQHLKREYVCDVMQQLRDSYSSKETLDSFLDLQLQWFRDILSGKEDSMWHSTYRQGHHATETLNYYQYYGVLSEHQIRIITRSVFKSPRGSLKKFI